MHLMVSRALYLLSFFTYTQGYSLNWESKCLSSFEGHPAGVVFNCVDTITGAYFEQEIDCSVQAPTPLVLQRSYCSENTSFHLLPHCSLIIAIDPEEQPSYATSDQFTAIIGLTANPNGSALVYSGFQNTSKEIESILQLDLETNGEAITNQSKKAISAKTNLKNSCLKVEKEKCQLVTADGTIRKYEKCTTLPSKAFFCHSAFGQESEKFPNPSFYHLISESLPDGNQFLYHYTAQGELESIQAANRAGNKIFSSITFTYDASTITAQASDGQVITYVFEVIDNKPTLSKVNRSGNPNISYFYEVKPTKLLLKKKELPNGRFLALKYTEEGKVASLNIPEVSSPLYTFEYLPDATQVLDELGNKSIYTQSNKKLSTIEKFQKDGAEQLSYSTQKFFWGRKNETGQLIKTCVEENAKKEKPSSLVQQYYYDHYGNITKEKISTPSDTCQSNVEYFFTDDRFHNIEKEIDSKGTTTLYEYMPDSDLLIKKYILKNGNIKKRCLYFYNEDALLIRELIDDGFESNYKSTFGVQERQIRDIEPRTYPLTNTNKEIIKEKYYDPLKNEERLKKSTHHTIDAQGRCIKREVYDCSDILAKTEEFLYDAHGSCTKYINPLGHITLNTYDANDAIIRKEEKAKGLTTTYQYNFNNRLLSTKERFSDGNTIVQVTEYDSLGNKIALIDRTGNRTELLYDSLSRLVSIKMPKVLDQDEKPISPTWTFEYDVFGNMISKKDPKNYETRYRYNGKGKTILIEYPDTTKEAFEWSENDLLLKKTHRNKTYTDYVYDFDNRLTASTTFPQSTQYSFRQKLFEYSTFRCTKARNENGSYSVYRYDSAGRLITEIHPSDGTDNEHDPHSKQTDYIYDSLGRLYKTKKWTDQKNAVVEVRAYDCLDRLIETWIEQANGSKTCRKNFTYDAFDNITTKKEGDTIEETKYLYGSFPSLIKKNNMQIQLHYHNHINELGLHYLEKEIKYPNDTSIRITHDPLGREILISAEDTSGCLLYQRKQLFDASGNLAVSIDHILPQSENAPQNRRKEWIYGPMNQLKEAHEGLGSELQKTEYSYSSTGNIASTNYGNEHHLHSYDEFGNLTQIQKQVDKNNLETILSFDHDRMGNIIAAHSQERISTFRKYTAQNKLAIDITKDEYGQYRMSYEYDRLGRIKKVLLPDESSIEYIYNGIFLYSIERKSKTNTRCYYQSIEKYTNGKLPAETLLIHNGGGKKITYNEFQELASISTDNFKEQIVEQDLFGNPLEITRGEEKAKYEYNSLGQISQENGLFNHTYFHDSLGNLKQIDSKNFTYNSLNELISDSTFTYSYDHRGNLKEILSKDGKTSFSYNACNQLISCRKSNSEKVDYKWDVFGRRIQRVDSEKNEPQRMIYVGTTEIGSISKRGAIQELKIPQEITDTQATGIVALELNCKEYLPITDLFNNIVCLINAPQKRILETYYYSAFGQECIFKKNGKKIDDSDYENPWRYRGLRKDPATGLIWCGAYDYNPSTYRVINSELSMSSMNSSILGYGNPLRRHNPIDQINSNTKNRDYNKATLIPQECLDILEHQK